MSWTVYLDGVSLAELKKLKYPRNVKGALAARRAAVALADALPGPYDVSIEVHETIEDPDLPEGAVQRPPSVTVSVARNLVAVPADA